MLSMGLCREWYSLHRLLRRLLYFVDVVAAAAAPASRKHRIAPSVVIISPAASACSDAPVRLQSAEYSPARVTAGIGSFQLVEDTSITPVWAPTWTSDAIHDRARNVWWRVGFNVDSVARINAGCWLSALETINRYWLAHEAIAAWWTDLLRRLVVRSLEIRFSSVFDIESDSIFVGLHNAEINELNGIRTNARNWKTYIVQRHASELANVVRSIFSLNTLWQFTMLALGELYRRDGTRVEHCRHFSERRLSVSTTLLYVNIRQPRGFPAFIAEYCNLVGYAKFHCHKCVVWRSVVCL